MSYFLKRVADSKRRFLDRAVAIAAAGSTLLLKPAFKFIIFGRRTLINLPSNLGASVTARVPFPLQNSQVLHNLLPRHLPYFDQAGILGFSSYRVGPVPSPDISKETSGAVGSKSSDYFGRHTIANAAAKVGPAVVNITVSQGLGIGSGSGTIINKDGTILTRAHVVFDFRRTRSLSEGEVEVTLQDGRTFEGKVVNADMHSDIAIVKINSETPLPEAKLGSSSTLRPGDLVIAMGCPHSLQNTVTAGIVSCVDRKSSDLGFSGTPREYLQTDCAVNVGYSGGPLVNMDGEVIGVNIIKVKQVSTDDGLSFSVPIDSVSKIVEHFKKSGRVVRPWLGLELFDLNEMIIAQLKKEDASFPNVDKGILVPMVMPGSPGDRAGFHPDDVVVEFDGKPVESINEVIEIMWDKVGVPIKVLVKRASDKLVTLTVIPEEESDLDV
ncbi:putative protease Do-like 14 isoform X2 [Gastrolobium bilobum]|uniref:putative protease Do-like 14 isoform X2 n=1 Tax=Gastrolobium bilobum TaxID=150636 RepID=UPI002AB2D31E|nr:putative protease Do-like 14 isoform X2 [Gastrolobium bilobum]